MGEYYRLDELTAAAGGVLPLNQQIVVEDVQCLLVPEPFNAHDPNAVMVIANGYHVGYLSREDAIRYRPLVRRIVASGYLPGTIGRIWAFRTSSDISTRVQVAIPHADLLPLNQLPDREHKQLPWGSGLQVTKEEEHFDVLFNFVPPSGEGFLYSTLHRGVRTLRNGQERPYVELRIDGERVGEMSPVTSQHFLPTIEHLESLGIAPVATVKIKGSALAAQLVLQAARASEIPDEWVEAGPDHAMKLVPWSLEYEIPAGWDSGFVASPGRDPKAGRSQVRTVVAAQSLAKGAKQGSLGWAVFWLCVAGVFLICVIGTPIAIVPAAWCGFLGWRQLRRWRVNSATGTGTGTKG
ncbi:HIRAN domain-containing protein [Arthrobacter woluwensis]|uniref:HIRAN domain-containing protein n=1 Tax=Arthrobacter woluwensis TaxID=156980 RepID=UPI0012F99632|nr:HIRAN domain-containing protein [Arthrobacter woluwensis]